MEQLDINQLVRNDLERIVSVEPHFDGTAALFKRCVDGSVERSLVPFKPWLLISPQSADFLEGAEELIAQYGEGPCPIRATFPNFTAYDKAIKQLKKANGFYRQFTDLTQQFLSLYPARLFGNMSFDELRRMQLDIETFSVGEPHFPDPNRPDDEIFLVSLKDNTGWETYLSITDSSEPELLQKLIQTIQERDPDVIEGHNIFNFDLKYIATRCKLHHIPFAIGRDGSAPKVRESRLTAGERIIPFTRFDIYGRHVVDTLHLVLLYDIIHRDMDRHTLKYAAKYFNVASPERTYIEASNITELFKKDPETVTKYCLDDVRETDAISRILSPSFFYQTRLIPLSYQSCITRGNGSRIDALLCADYLLNNNTLPLPQKPVPYQGALTEGDLTGVFTNVWHVDVRSLYPSIIISKQLTPVTDTQGVFLRLLTDLRKFRLAAKDARKSASPEMRTFYDALQSTFKILINSFYGYAGFSQGTFNDFTLASFVTATGRQILSSMRDFLEQSDCTVIEMDTDGIYFKPPEGELTPSEMEKRIQAILPPGIEIEMDACYKAMFGYKSKNYALLHPNGKITLSGAALISRGLEPFQRQYIKDFITLLLTGRQQELPELYERTVQEIESHSLPIASFAQKEILSSSLKTYQEKLAAGTGKHSAAYDLALLSGKEYKQGDTVEFYVIGNKKTVSVTGNSKLLSQATPDLRDENIPFYLSKLEKLHKKFMETLPPTPESLS